MIRKLIPILGITFIDIIGFSMLLPVLPYFVTHFGMSAFVVGLSALDVLALSVDFRVRSGATSRIASGGRAY